MILAIQNSFFVPIEMVFSNSSLDNPLYFVFSLIVDLIFLLDMVVICLTTFRDNKGKEVKDVKKIMANNFRSFRFYPDLLALLGS